MDVPAPAAHPGLCALAWPSHLAMMPCARVVACARPHEGLLANLCLRPAIRGLPCREATHTAWLFPEASSCCTTLLSLGASLDLPRRAPHLSPRRFTPPVQFFSFFSPALLNCQRPTASTADKGARDKRKT